MKQPNVLDLFCGCGGLSKGFEDAGYRVLLGVDNDAAALETFTKNHKNSKSLNADVSSSDVFDVIAKLVDENIDVVIAGPPCQGFSLTGPRNFDDERNRLYLSVINAVEVFKPKAFVIENVPGMKTLYNGEIKNEIVHRFEKMGYKVKTKILCAADYGVPQMRNRLIFVGIKNGQDYIFPKETHSANEYVTCEDAISDLPDRKDIIGKEVDEYTNVPRSEYQKKMRNNCELLYNHVATNHTQMVKDVISLVPEGGNYKDLPPGVGESRKFNEAWTRYHSKKPSKTIDTGHRNHFHYKYDRVPTIRENARLQSFRDDFIFLGTKTQQNRQVGNAVPPILGRVIGESLLSLIIVKGDNSDEEN